MIYLLKILVIVCCAVIALQDFRERAVQWILFPLLGILLTLIYLKATSFEQYLLFATTNILLVSLILLLLFLYTKHIAKMEFLNVSFGLGDLLFFFAFALGFPTMTFIILFVGSILFSLVTHLLSKSKIKEESIPLAGLMSLFLIGIIMASLFPNTPSLYLI